MGIPRLLFLLSHLLMLLRFSSSDVILIDCGAGGNSAGGDGRVWSGDEGLPLLLVDPSSSTFPASPLGPTRPVPFSTARISRSSFTYSIPAVHDRYFVRLHFSPSDHALLPASAASFDVAAGPHTLLKSFNPYSHAKMLNLDYIIREYSINVSSSGWLNITFTPSSNVSNAYAFVNGIELVSMPDIFLTTEVDVVAGTGVMYNIDKDLAVETMHRLNVGGGAIPPSLDSGDLYRTWSDDTPYVADAELGITFSRDANVSLSYPPSLPKYIAPVRVYASARSMPWYGGDVNLKYNMSWILTVDPGFYYLVRLHFCEIQHPFTLPNQRVFTIYVNNHTALSDFDVISRSREIGVPVFYDSITVIPDGDSRVDLWVSLHPYTKYLPQYENVILNGLEVFKLSNFYGSLAAPPTATMFQSMYPAAGISCSDMGRKLTRIFCAPGAILLISLLVYMVYYVYRRNRSVVIRACDHLPLVMSGSGQTEAVGLPLCNGDTCDLVKIRSSSDSYIFSSGNTESRVNIIPYKETTLQPQPFCSAEENTASTFRTSTTGNSYEAIMGDEDSDDDRLTSGSPFLQSMNPKGR